jgi:hypothetical protein
MSSQEFYLSVFDTSFTSIQATLPLKDIITPDFSANIYVDITQTHIRSIFQYDTSSVITHINDLSSDDLRYYVDIANFPQSNSGGVIADVSLVSDSTMNLKGDYIRDLALQLFNTPRGVDLFSNEDALLADFKSKSDTVWTNIRTIVTSVNKTNGTVNVGNGTDGKSRFYLTNNNTTTTNLTRELLLQMVDASNSRFQNIQNHYDSVSDLYAVPFEIGDKISFILTVHSHSNQKSIVGLSGPLMPRKYKISLNVING